MSDNGCIYTLGTPDIGKVYGLDVEDELTRILSNDLAKSIDQEILRGLGVRSLDEIMKEKLRDLLKKHLRDKNIDDIING